MTAAGWPGGAGLRVKDNFCGMRDMKRFGRHELRRVVAAGLGLLAGLGLGVGVGRAQPANDNFANAQVLVGDYGTVNVDSTGATAEVGEPSHAGYPAAASVWFKWTASTEGPVMFDTFGSTVDTVLAVYTGTAVSTLDFLVANDDVYYVGPSGVKFNAKQGQTYYIAVDGYAGDNGPITLSWAYHSAGVFRWTVDTYTCAETESGGAIDVPTSIQCAPGVVVTVTRVFGADGRASFTFDTTDDTATRGKDYRRPGKTTLALENYEMSKSFVIPIVPTRGDCGSNIDFLISLTGVAIDSLEDTNVIAPPRIDPDHSTGMVTIEDVEGDPTGASTNSCPTAASIVNFERAVYRVPESIGNAVIYVNRTGGGEARRIGYSIDSSPPVSGNLANNGFQLQAGSDYATPDPVTAGPIGIFPDFQPVQGELTWGTGDFNPKPITIPIYNDTVPEFNEDLLVNIYPVPGASDNATVGNVSQATVTILYDDYPAGGLDDSHNLDHNLSTDPPVNTRPGANSTVYGLAVQADDKTIIVGDFNKFNAQPRNRIARLNFDGSNDAFFNPGTGANDFISAVSLGGAGKIVIGGGFTSFNGTQRYHIARLNGDGSLDASFNPGLGADDTVWAIAVQQDGRVIIGGDFLTVNGLVRGHIARLNADGSVDNTFDPGTNAPNATVHAIAVAPDGSVVIGGEFTALGAFDRHGVARLNADGTVDTTFTPGTGANGPVYALGLQLDGSVVIGGSFTQVDLRDRRNIARVLPTGALDLNFVVGSGADDVIYTITLANDGGIYLGGLFTSINGTRRMGVARLFSTGEVDTGWLDTAYNQYAGLFKPFYNPYVNPKNFLMATALQSDGNLMIGGSFNYVGGGRFSTIVRTNDTTPVDTTPYQRVTYRPRDNVARLLGGSTIGPGSTSFVADNYSVNEDMSYLYLKIMRTNGTLGQIESTFSLPSRTLGPGIAQSGVDYNYNRINPLWTSTIGSTRMWSDGIYGTNNISLDAVPNVVVASAADDIYITVPHRLGFQGDRSAPLKLDMPSSADVFFLGGANLPLGSALGKSSAMLTVNEVDTSPGVFSFSTPTFTVNENATNAIITITRSNGSTGPVSVRFATTNGTAVAGVDYIGVTNTLSFGDGITSRTVKIPINNDSIIQTADRTVNLYLANPGNGATIGVSNALLYIIDDDYLPGHLNLAATAYTTNETAPAAVLTVNRAGGNSGTMTVQYLTRDGTAFNGVNYIGSTNTLLWNDGDTAPKTITVPLIHDGLVTPNKNLVVSLFNARVNGTNATYALGSRTNATVTLLNQDFYGSPQFSAASYVVNENAGYATITVIRTGGSAETISVNFATTNGTAFATGPLPNYVATNGTLTFGPGEVSKSFTVPVLDDGVIDPTPFFFSVGLSLLSPSGATYGTPTTAVVNIKDIAAHNEPPGSVDTGFDPTAGMDDDVYSVALQPDGKILAAGNFTRVHGLAQNRLARLNPDGSLDTGFLAGLSGANAAVRTMISQSDTRVVIGGAFTTMNSINRSYLARLNYDGSIDTGFDPGAGADAPVFAVAETFMPDRRLVVGGSFNTFNGFVMPGLVRLNDDGTVDTSFSPSLGVNGTVYSVVVYPTNGIHANQILIGGNFSAVNGITRSNLARLNVDGSLDATFDPGTGTDAAVRAMALQTDGRILIGGTFTNVNGQALNHLARLNDDGSVDASFNVGVGANDVVYGLALQPDNRIVVVGDFTRASGVTRNRITRLMPDGTVDPTINFGTGANSFIASVAIQPDGKFVIGGGFTQVQGLSRPHLARLYGGSMTGSGRLSFTSAAYQVNENGTNVIVTVQRSGGTSGPGANGQGDITVQFATSDGTAVGGVNYTPVAATLDFPMGETMQTVTIPVMDDLQITPDLTVNLTLSNPTVPAQLGDQAGAVLTIVNVDSAVGFSSPVYSRPEDAIDGVASIHVLRNGSSQGTASVDFFTTTNGTAVPLVNYVPVTNTVTFLPGDTDKLVKVPVIHNPAATGDKTVIMDLSNPVNTILVNPKEATLTVIDVDRAPGQFVFSSPSYVVGEGDGSAIITVVRTNGRSGVVSVAYTTVPGTATPGLKYTSTNGVLTFADGETSKSFAVQILEENQVEGSENLTIALSNPTGGATIFGSPSAPLTILDDDIGLSFSSPAYVVNETDGAVVLTVLRLNGTNLATTVDYSTTNGTALAGSNYVATSGTLTFNVGEALKTITVPVLHDPRVTGNLTFSVYLANASGSAQLVPPNPATVVVVDTDAGLSLTNNAFSVLENATNVTFTVVRSNANTGTVTVNYTTADDTALAGVDYTATSGVLVFTNGETLKTFTVPIIDNKLVQPDRSFSVNLFNPTPGAQLLDPSSATVTIIDNDAGLRFSAPTYRVMKNGVMATMGVQRIGYTNSTVAVDYATEDGTAKAGVNYFPASGSLIFTNGETQKTISVGVIDDNVVTGDKTVLLKLANPLGDASVVAPGAATLTIVDSNGSLIVPAGAALAAESLTPTNGVIDPNETVTLLFAFRNTGGLTTSNLVATLLATNGVVSPSAARSYGALTVGGPSVSRPFSFTAAAANGSRVIATFALSDGTNNLGQAVFTFAIGTATMTFSNQSPVVINDAAPASPYPAVINVGGVDGLVSKATVTLAGLSHGSPADVDALLVGPAGQALLLMANSGGSRTVSGVNLTFDDAASNALPLIGQITSGRFRPTAYMPVATFPTPAPPEPYATNLAAFNGSNPNGPWSLYIIDDTPLDAGSISNGWALTVSTANPVGSAADVDLTMTATPEPVIITSNLTYTLTVTNHGPSIAAGVLVTNVLPAGVQFVSATTATGSATTNSAGIVTWSVGSLAMDASATLTLVVSPTVAGSLPNTAGVTGATPDLNPDNNAASVISTVVSPTADLAIGLVGTPSPVLAGYNLTYSITVTNLGPATAANVMVTNKLPAGAGFVTVSPSQGTGGLAGNAVWANLGNLGAGLQAQVTLVVRPTLAGNVTDTVNTVSSTTDPLKGNNTATIKTVVLDGRMSVVYAGNTVTIGWADASGATLQRATSLQPPVVWSDVTSPAIVIAGGQRSVTVTATNTLEFFRLKPPTP